MTFGRATGPLLLALGILFVLLATGLLGVSLLDGSRPGLRLWCDGAWKVLLTSAWVVLVTATVALVAGGLGALGPPLADGLVSRATEISLALPSVVTVVVLQALGVDDIVTIGGTVAAVRGLSAAKATRAELHALSTEDFALAARAAGASRLRLLRRHFLPHVLEGVLGQAALTAATVVALDAAVAFLGLGSPTSGWGALLSEAARTRAPGLGLAPALGVAAVTGALLVVAAHLGGSHRTGRRFV